MDSLLHDLRYAARQLARRPGYAAVALLTLALGLGATTAIFSVVNGVLLSPLAYPRPDRLVMVWERNVAHHVETNTVNPGNFNDWRHRATSFTGLAAASWASLTFTGGSPEIVPGRAVTAGFFGVMGTAPELGRVFTADEAAPGGPAVIVLSDGLWRHRFGADSSVIGRAVSVAGGTVRVVGVMPPGFGPLPYGQERYWEPSRLDPNDRSRHGRYLVVVGRLKPGATIAQAQAEMDRITPALAREFPRFDTGWGANVVSLTDQVIGSARTGLFIALAAVGIVLLIACANVGNLMLVRVDARRREFALRTALGASRRRLVRQWLAESLVVAALGGALGLLLARWGVDFLLALRPADIPRLASVTIDVRVIAVAAALTLVVGVAAGLPAALQGASRGFMGALRAGDARATADHRTGRFRSSLAVAQISLALVLLAGAGLLVRSLARLTAVDPGFDSSHVLSFAVDLPSATYPDAEWAGFFDRLTDRLRAIPGVTAAGAVSYLPLTINGAATSFDIVGRPPAPPGQATGADIRIVDTGYFAAMRIRLERGRRFTADDRAGAAPVVVVNETMARRYWPDGNPLGARLRISWTHPDATPEIVGVVGDVRAAGLDAPVYPTIYYPEAQEPSSALMMVARTASAPAGLAPAARAAVRTLDPELPVSDVATLDERLVRSTSGRRYPMLLLAVFAALAVVLAAVGIYGVLSYAVAERRREFGVRIALGASTRDVLTMVLGGGLRLALLGVCLGALGAAVASRALRGLLYGVSATDPATFAAVSALLVLVALLAVALPALRATRVDPMSVLRSE